MKMHKACIVFIKLGLTPNCRFFIVKGREWAGAPFLLNV
jgi:hypothetical protein